MLKLSKLLTLFAAMLLNTASLAQEVDTSDSEKYIAGTHYEVLSTPIRTQNPNKIEATEVFWYGCSHCYRFEPLVVEWAKKLPDDVSMVKSPAIWHPTMKLHAQAFYTAVALGVLDDLHSVLFEEMNLRKKKLASESAIGKLFAAHGVDSEKFLQTFNSFGVTAAVQQAEARQRGYKITGTPEMVVNGKYRITARMAGSQEGMLSVASYLIEKERQLMAEQAAALDTAPATKVDLPGAGAANQSDSTSGSPIEPELAPE